MKKIFTLIFILVSVSAWGAKPNKNSWLIREMIEARTIEHITPYGEKYYDFVELGKIYVAGCHPEYLYYYNENDAYSWGYLFEIGQILCSLYTYENRTVSFVQKDKIKSLQKNLKITLWRFKGRCDYFKNEYLKNEKCTETGRLF